MPREIREWSICEMDVGPACAPGQVLSTRPSLFLFWLQIEVVANVEHPRFALRMSNLTHFCRRAVAPAVGLL